MGTICYIKRDNVQIPYTDGFCDGYIAGATEETKEAKEIIKECKDFIHEKFYALSDKEMEERARLMKRAEQFLGEEK